MGCEGDEVNARCEDDEVGGSREDDDVGAAREVAEAGVERGPDKVAACAVCGPRKSEQTDGAGTAKAYMSSNSLRASSSSDSG